MDKFEEYLNKKDELEYVKRALTDTSYKKIYQNENGAELSSVGTNFELATLGDSLLRTVLCETFLDSCKQLSKTIENYLTDKVLIEVIAKHYSILDYLRIDDTDLKIKKDYVYNRMKKKKLKYIATAIEAMIGAIYLESKDYNLVKEIIQNWISLIVN